MRTSRSPFAAAFSARRKARIGFDTYHASNAATARLAKTPPNITCMGGLGTRTPWCSQNDMAPAVLADCASMKKNKNFQNSRLMRYCASS